MKSILSFSVKNCKRFVKYYKQIIIITLISTICMNLFYSFLSNAFGQVKSSFFENENLNVINISRSFNPDENAELMSYSDIEKIDRTDGVLCAFPSIIIDAPINNDFAKDVLTVIGIPDEILHTITGEHTHLAKGMLLLHEENKTTMAEYTQNEKVSIGFVRQVADNAGEMEYFDYAIAGYYRPDDSFFEYFNLPHGAAIASIDDLTEKKALFYHMDIDSYRIQPDFLTAFVFVEDMNKTVPVANLLEESGFETSYSLKAMKQIPETLHNMVIIGGIVCIFIFLLTLIITSNSIKQLLFFRRRELGILQSLGMCKAQMSWMILLELLLLSGMIFISSLLLFLLILLGINGYLGYRVLTFDCVQVFFSFLAVLFVLFLSSFIQILKTVKSAPDENIRLL